MFADRTLSPWQLELALAWAPQSSLRRSLTNLTQIGAVTRSCTDGRTHGAAIELTRVGHELLPVAAALERWLEESPHGPIRLEDSPAQGVIRVLTAGWDSKVVHALAERPRSLLELSAAIPEVNYPALRRRLSKLRATGLVVPVETNGGHTYEVSDWLRRAVVPLTLAGRWERRHQTDSGQPITDIEIEATFILALPLVRLPARASGACALAVLTSEERTRAKRKATAVILELKRGEIISCVAGVASDQPTWALGTADAWLEALVDGRAGVLRVSGAKPALAKGIVRALHDDLFRRYVVAPSAQAKPADTAG